MSSHRLSHEDGYPPQRLTGIARRNIDDGVSRGTYTSISLQLTFNRTYTLGNPLRDLAMPTITWTIMDPSEYAQYEWKEIEFPQLFSWARLIYGLDTLGLRRVGTSPILPKQGRALEWSKRGLNEWSRYLKVNKCKPEDIPAHSPLRRFGQPEMPFLAAALQLLFMRFSFQWLYALAAATSEMISVLGFYIPVGKRFTLLGVPTSAFDLPLLTRLGMVLSVGGAVCLLGAVAEGTMLLFWKPKPATSFLSTFNRPVTSPGLARLWARSWHAASQRDYLNMASSMPFSRYEPLQLLYVFFWSGVQHSWMFSRLRTSPTAKITLLTVLTGMLDQGMITFFISQGVGIWIEKAALDAMPAAWKKQRFLIGLARRLWMFTVLVLRGMLFLDSLLRCQLMTKDILDGFGLRALGLMVQGKKY
ncbi:uncharacterized protein UHOD_01701 [Ustilago sp. UG-2017b]|nr:uncharacterized protein UHOD_01701 [Ustilago sp. UG-2017b]